jgi:hypothetical protein
VKRSGPVALNCHGPLIRCTLATAAELMAVRTDRRQACSLRKATLIASIVAKTSIPMLHSSVALLKLAEKEYSGAAACISNRTGNARRVRG